MLVREEGVWVKKGVGGGACYVAAKKRQAIMVICSVCRNISGCHSSTCSDAAYWGFAREIILDFVFTVSVYIASLMPLGRGDDAEALL